MSESLDQFQNPGSIEDDFDLPSPLLVILIAAVVLGGFGLVVWLVIS